MHGFVFHDSAQWILAACPLDNRVGGENPKYGKNQCYGRLNNTPLPTIIYDLLQVELEHSPIYPYIDLQQSFTIDSSHTDFKAWMTYDPEICTQNKERIDKCIQLFINKYED